MAVSAVISGSIKGTNHFASHLGQRLRLKTVQTICILSLLHPVPNVAAVSPAAPAQDVEHDKTAQEDPLAVVSQGRRKQHGSLGKEP